MRAVVVYESMYGNTREVAQAIADGLSRHGDASVVEVGTVSQPPAADLLVVGGPTHAHGMSRGRTRDAARKDAPHGLISSGIGLREWFTSLRPAPGGLAATFDTRYDKPRWLTGSAAHGAARRLRRLGYELIAPVESFWITGATGPLAAGEVDRARRWGEMLGTAVASGQPSPGVR